MLCAFNTFLYFYSKTICLSQEEMRHFFQECYNQNYEMTDLESGNVHFSHKVYQIWATCGIEKLIQCISWYISLVKFTSCY